METHRYLVILEKGDGNYGVYAPDLPGCVAVGNTPQEALKNMQEAVALHLEGMRQDGDTIPEPASTAEYVEA